MHTRPIVCVEYDLYLQCLAWYPKPNPDHLLAVGLANGKVVLTR